MHIFKMKKTILFISNSLCPDYLANQTFNMTFNLPSAEGRSRKGDSLLGVLALGPLKRESGNRMQTDACLSSKNLLSGETREKTPEDEDCHGN